MRLGLADKLLKEAKEHQKQANRLRRAYLALRALGIGNGRKRRAKRSGPKKEASQP